MSSSESDGDSVTESEGEEELEEDDDFPPLLLADNWLTDEEDNVEFEEDEVSLVSSGSNYFSVLRKIRFRSSFCRNRFWFRYRIRPTRNRNFEFGFGT